MSDYRLSFEEENSRTMRGESVECTETVVVVRSGFGSSATWLRNGMLSRSRSNEEQSSHMCLLPPSGSQFHSLPNGYTRHSSSKAGGPEEDSSTQSHPKGDPLVMEVSDLRSSTDDEMTFQRARELFRTMESSVDKCNGYRQGCLPLSNRCTDAVSNRERSTDDANVFPPPPPWLTNEFRTSFCRNGFTLNNCSDTQYIQSEKGRSRPGSLSLMDESTEVDVGTTLPVNRLIFPTVDLPSMKDANANTVDLPESPSNRTSRYPPILPKPKHYQKCRILPQPTTDQGPLSSAKERGPLRDQSPTMGHGPLTDHGPTIGHGPLTNRGPGVSTEMNVTSVVLFLNSLPNSKCSSVHMNDSVYTNDSVQKNHSDRLLTNSQDHGTDFRNSSDIVVSRTEARCDRGLKREDTGGHGGEVVWRRSQLGDSHSQRALGGVLLPKRRSRDEGSLGVSRESVEAALSEAGGGGFWKMDETIEEMENRMLESTCSSGSGEEMAQPATLDRSLSELNPSPVDDDPPSSIHRWSEGDWTTALRGQGVKGGDTGEQLSAAEAGHQVHPLNDHMQTINSPNNLSVTCGEVADNSNGLTSSGSYRLLNDHYGSIDTDRADAIVNLLSAERDLDAMEIPGHGTETETETTVNRKCLTETETTVHRSDPVAAHRMGEQEYELETETDAGNIIEREIETETGESFYTRRQQITDDQIGMYRDS